MSYQWRFLLIEDKDDIAGQVLEAVGSFVDAPDTAVLERESNFKEGMKRLTAERFDILILDLKDDQNTQLEEHDVSAGLEIFEALKSIRFAPVIFYTAHAHKVKDLISPFVRVVEKSEGLEKLEEEVRNVIATGLPQLTQTIERIQREYMWDFAASHWKEFDEPQHKTDIAYLLARRLAAKLEIESAALARHMMEHDVPPAIGTDVHPMQMYVYPPIEQLQGGSIVRGEISGVDGHWIVLTPTCDLMQGKAQSVLLARCCPLIQSTEYVKWLENNSNTTLTALTNLIGDNRKNMQAERYKFLPGTFFFEDSVVDFQDTRSIALDDVKILNHIASLDSPFSEALIGRFARYFGRLGTPDVSKDAVIKRLHAKKENPLPVMSVTNGAP